MSDDLIETDFSKMQKQLGELEKKLSRIEKDVCGSIMDKALNGAANILSAELKRILSAAPTEGIRSLSAELSVWKDNKASDSRKSAWKAGYHDSKIGTGQGKSIKYFVIEFGRPGKKGDRKDKKGRKIGRIAPYSHIRAAWFLKRNEINKYITERVDKEILERWNG